MGEKIKKKTLHYTVFLVFFILSVFLVIPLSLGAGLQPYLISPANNINVSQKEFFAFEAGVRCIGSCGNVTATLDPKGKSGYLPSNELLLKSKTFVPDGLRLKNNALVLDKQSGIEKGKREHIIIQFDNLLTTDEKKEFEKKGIKFLRYIPNKAWLVSRPIDKAIEIPGARWYGGLQPEDKISENILSDNIGEWSINPDGELTLLVQFYPDVATKEAEDVIKLHKGRAGNLIKTINTLAVKISRDKINALASEDKVVYIGEFPPPLTAVNDEARQVTGAGELQNPPFNLDGSGINVYVYDGGMVENTHGDLAGRTTWAETGSTSSHPTHVACTVGGTGARSVNFGGTPLQWRGMAPNVTITSGEYESCTPYCLYNSSNDIEEDYNLSIHSYNVDIATNSIGSNVAPNGYPCAWEGDYELTTQLVDGIIRGSLGRPLPGIWANGNERGSGRCGTSYYTTAPPATMKNSVSVGATTKTDTISSFTSFGPTDDGRLKPDVSAPGVSLYSCSTGNSYTTMSGTSMATPATTGNAALMMQAYQMNHSGVMLPPTIKALLMHTAHELGNPGPDYQFGYGRINSTLAVAMIQQDNPHNLLIYEGNITDQGEPEEFTVAVPQGAESFRITIAWSDYPGTPLALKELVNDLDLVVISPSNVRYYPWTLDPLNPGSNAVRSQEDHTNNAEQVLVDSPQPGRWKITVAGTVVPEAPQEFSVVSDYAIELGKGAVPMHEGTPFYTISQNPLFPQNLSCLRNMQDNSCNQTWIVNATGEHLSVHQFFVLYEATGGENQTGPVQTGTINIGILGNFEPEINTVECQENSTIWQDCQNTLYGDYLTSVRVNCTDPDGIVTNANVKLENIPDNNIFFNATAVQNGDYWVYDNADILIEDSGEWRLSAACTDDGGSDGIKQGSAAAEWLIPWGILEPYIVEPLTDIDVYMFTFFNFSSGVNCVGGECGNVTAILDPLHPLDPPGLAQTAPSIQSTYSKKLYEAQRISEKEMRENKAPELRREWVRIWLQNENNENQLDFIASLELDVTRFTPESIEAVATTREIEKLKQRGIEAEILPFNRGDVFSQTGFEDYHTYEEANSFMQAIEAGYPNIAKMYNIGSSIEGRAIWAMKISDNVNVDENEPEIAIFGNHHAREVMTVEIPLYEIQYLATNYETSPKIKYLVDNREIWLVPTTNPDGLKYVETNDPMWRKNRRDNGGGIYGVDLNRNYGYQWGYDDIGSSPYPSSETYRGTAAFSEPEAQAIRDLYNSRNFALSLSYHSYGELLLYPWGYVVQQTPEHSNFTFIAGKLTETLPSYTTGMPGELLYTVNGGSDDWMYGEQSTKNKIMAQTFEVNSAADGGFRPDPSLIIPTSQEHIPPFLNLLELTGEPYSQQQIKYAVVGHAGCYDSQLDEIEIEYPDIAFVTYMDDISIAPGDTAAYPACDSFFNYLDGNGYIGIWAGNNEENSYGICDITRCIDDGTLQQWIKTGHSFIGTYGSMDLPDNGPSGNKFGDLAGISNAYDGTSSAFTSPIYISQQHPAQGNAPAGTTYPSSYTSTWNLADSGVTTGAVIARMANAAGNPEIVIVDNSNYKTAMAGNYLESNTMHPDNHKYVHALALWAGRLGKGVVPMYNGTPFYTIHQNPVNCGAMKAGDNCGQFWTVNATGEHLSQWDFFAIYKSTYADVNEKNTNTTKVRIIGNYAPKISEAECQENSTAWQDCQNTLYGDYLTSVRVNCTDTDGIVTNVNVKLENIPDNNIFFNATAIQNGDYWIYDNADILMEDSGEWRLSAACTDDGGSDGIKQGSAAAEWLIPWGILEPYLISPSGNTTVIRYNFFNFSSGVSCLGGECGDITASLDPQQDEEAIITSEQSAISKQSAISEQRKKDIEYIEDIEKAELPLTEKLEKEGSADVIVILKDAGRANKDSLQELRLKVKAKQNRVLSKLTADDFTLKYRYSTVNGFAGRITKKGFDKLKKEPDVEAVYPDPVLNIVLTESVPLVNADDVWGLGITGEESVVCVVDTGIDYTHPDLGSCFGAGCKVLDGYDFVFNDADPMDDHNHGTHVAGIVAANGVLKGVAPDANLVATKVCDSGGSCSGSAMIAGVDWCSNHSDIYNIVATTMSIGDGGQYDNMSCPTWMDSSINMAHDLGIAVTVASGNDYHSSGISYPACSPNAVSVGSTTKADIISGFTNTGDLLDVLAPGESIYSTIRGNSYAYFSGTSMATPHAAGAIALLKQYSPRALPDETEDALKATGVIIVDPDNGMGFPRIDILAALAEMPGKGVIPMSNGTPFYTISYNPYNSSTASCLADMKSGDSCNQTWTVNATGEHLSNWTFFTIYESDYGWIYGETGHINLQIIGNYVPQINKIQCQENSTAWQDCQNILYGDYLTSVRINCTDIDGIATNANVKLENIPDSNVFFNATAVQNGDYWVYDNIDILMQDSGEWRLSAACTDDGGSDGIKQGSAAAEWLIPWGVLEPYLISPLNNITVARYSFFNFSSGVSCIAGECGNVNASLDPAILLNLTTTNAGGNGHNGNMFNVIAKKRVTIRNFSAHWNSGPLTSRIYWHQGGYVTYDDGNWYLVGTAPITGASGTFIKIPLQADLTMEEGETYGFYITNSGGTDANIIYTDGYIENYFNNDLNLSDGIGIAYPFGTTFSPRIWNGIIWYEKGAGGEKGLIPMNNGTPFYTIDQNPETCVGLKAGDSCNTAWTVNATGEHLSSWTFFTIYNSQYGGVDEKQTDNINIQIIGNNPPELHKVECHDSISWTNCSGFIYKDTFSQVRVNCTDTDGIVTNVNVKLENIPDSNVFFDAAATQNGDYWVYDNADILIEDSGEWRLSAACTDNGGVDGIKQDEEIIQWAVPWGALEPYLISPTEPAYVNRYQFFSFSSGVSCIDGECGDVSAALDPEAYQNHDVCIWEYRSGNCNAVPGPGVCSHPYSCYNPLGNITSNPFVLENATELIEITYKFYMTECGYTSPAYNFKLNDITVAASSPMPYSCSCTGSPGEWPLTAVANDTALLNSAFKLKEANTLGIYSSGYPCTSWLEANITYMAGKGLVSTIIGTEPFYTIDQNPAACAGLKADDSCNTTWTVNATGEYMTSYDFFTIYSSVYGMENKTGIVNITIVANIPPEISSIECEKGSIWQSCNNTQYGNTLTGVRLNCTDKDGGVTAATLKLTNIPDNNILFDAAATQNGNYWVYDNADVLIQDSGEWMLQATCTDNGGVDGIKQDEKEIQWNVPWGVLEPYLISPTNNIDVARYGFFNFISGVSCTGGECSNITATLDPYGPDGFGYTALNSTEPNGDPFVWEEIITNNEGNPLWNIGDTADDVYLTAPIGFNFTFYNSTYSTVYVSSNGRIHFTPTGASYTSISLPSDSYRVVAPLNRDMYVRLQTQVYYKTYDSPKRLIVEYKELDYYSPSGSYFTYEAILYQDGRVKIQYNASSDLYSSGYKNGINHYMANSRYLLVEDDAPDLHKGEAVTFYPPDYNLGKGTIPMNSGTPFYTIDQNPTPCAGLKDGDSCNTTWRVNATGEVNTTWEFFTLYSSPYSMDGEKETPRVNITILYIAIPNRPPQIDAYSPLENPIINEGGSQSFCINKSDRDSSDLTVNWYFEKTADVTSAYSDCFNYKSSYESSGIYNVTAAVSDGEYVVSHAWNLTVENTNRPPELAALNYVVVVNETDLVKIMPNATDPDNMNSVDNDDNILSYYFTSPLNNSGEWKPDFGDRGNYTATVTVFDGFLNDSQTISIVVLPKIINFNLPLFDGWNMVSFPLNLTNRTISAVFAGISYNEIYTYRDNSYTLLNPAGEIDLTRGYWLDVNNDYNLTLTGTSTDNINYNLINGYNLISYPSVYENNVTYVFDNVNGSMANLLAYDNKNKKWKSYKITKPSELNTIRNISPGKGYLINLNKNITWAFDRRFIIQS